jgi:hypothetical protein
VIKKEAIINLLFVGLPIAIIFVELLWSLWSKQAEIDEKIQILRQQNQLPKQNSPQ